MRTIKLSILLSAMILTKTFIMQMKYYNIAIHILKILIYWPLMHKHMINYQIIKIHAMIKPIFVCKIKILKKQIIFLKKTILVFKAHLYIIKAVPASILIMKKTL